MFIVSQQFEKNKTRSHFAIADANARPGSTPQITVSEAVILPIISSSLHGIAERVTIIT